MESLKFGAYSLLDSNNDLICHVNLMEHLTRDEWEEKPEKQDAWLENYAFKHDGSICEIYKLFDKNSVEDDWQLFFFCQMSNINKLTELVINSSCYLYSKWLKPLLVMQSPPSRTREFSPRSEKCGLGVSPSRAPFQDRRTLHH